MSKKPAYIYNWELDIEPHLKTMQDVSGGFTPAKRGIVTLEDGAEVFVKIATDEDTAKWLRKEIKAYQKLIAIGYRYIPILLSFKDDESAMAIEYLAGCNFENIWNKDKLDAVVKAQESLGHLTSAFKDDDNFKSDDVMDLGLKWPLLLDGDNLVKVNQKLSKLGFNINFSREQIKLYQERHKSWSLKKDVLVHQDVRADNFGYDPITKEGKLVDWNWLSVGDASLDTTPLFVSMYKDGFDAYEYHPEKYDEKMIIYLVGFWLASILHGDEDSSDREWRMRETQADSLRVCLELLSRK